jgi:hypothetical protein
VRRHEKNGLLPKMPFKGSLSVVFVYLIIPVLLLVLIIGMQIQISGMNKKLDELTGVKRKPKK